MSIAEADDARELWPCPLAKAFDRSIRTVEKGNGYCIADACPVWRWEELKADPAFLAAVTKAMGMERRTRSGRVRNLTHAEAVHRVVENRAEFGLPEKPFRGWCGLGGKPEA